MRRSAWSRFLVQQEAGDSATPALYSHVVIYGADTVAHINLTPELLDIVAGRFKVLGEPVRLQILNTLRDGEMSVTEIVEATGLGQANISKHLRTLHGLGFITRRKEGLYVYCSLADRTVFRLCDIMCGRLEAETSARRKVLAAR